MSDFKPACGATYAEQFPDVMSAIQELIREKNIQVENLTRDQIAEALIQAIQCGDFTRFVVVQSDQQTVSYTPFRREQELIAKHNGITEMISRFLVAHRDIHRCWIKSFVEVGAITADFGYHPNIKPVKL